jgi:hypothetical protein
MPARHLSRLPRPDRAERGRRALDRHGALGQKRAAKLEAKGQRVDLAEMLGAEPDSDGSAPTNRCLVPFTSFFEYDTIDGKKVPVWFAIDESRPALSLCRDLDQLDLRA